MPKKLCPKCKKEECFEYPKGCSEQFSDYCKKCTPIVFKEYYEKNRRRVIDRVLQNLKKNNYSNEKTPEQRKIRNIKRKTRNYFPLENHNCEFCGNEATEHHHNTLPIEFDKFNYCCHKCHPVLNNSVRRIK